MIARNISANYLGIGVRTLVLLALTPFVVRHLGTTGYAVWVLIQTIFLYLKFLDFGLYSATVKYLAAYVGGGRQKEINDLIASVLGGFFIAGFAAFGLSLVIAEFLVPLFRQVPPELTSEFQKAFIIFGASMLIGFPGMVATGIYEGHQRYDLFNLTTSGVLLLKSLGTIILLSMGNGILQLAVLEIGVSAIAIAGNILIIRRLFPEITLAVKFSRTSVWRMRNYRLWSSLNKMLSEGSSQLDKLLLPLFLSVSLLTPYAIVCTMASILLVIIEPFARVLFTMSSAEEAKLNHEGLKRTLILATKAGFAISLPPAIVLASMGNFLIDLWIGNEYVQPPPGLLPIMVGCYLVSVFFMPATSMLAGMAKQKIIFIFSALTTALALGLVIISVRRYELIGIAAGIAAANLVISFGGLLPFTCRQLQVSLTAYLREGLVLPLLPGLPALTAAYVLIDSRPPENLFLLMAYSGVIAVVYAAGFYFFAVSKKDRAFFVYRLRQLLAGASLSMQGRMEK